MSLLICLSMSCSEKTVVQNPMEQLGHYLFFDTHLSLNNTKSCASCHDPNFAFTDGYRKSVSPLGENLKHNAPSLMNTQHYNFYDWSRPEATNYTQQMQRPLYGKHPVELGLDLHWESFKQYLNNSATYRPLLSKALKGKRLTQANLEQALAAYLRTLQARNAQVDQYMKGQKDALSRSARRGFALFTNQDLKCVRCHIPPDFTKITESKNLDSTYINIGLYNIEGQNAYPIEDQGLIEYSKKEKDNGRFRIPSLRNVALTAPYMHDGSVATLSEVIDIYANGGRGDDSDKIYGNGPANKWKHEFISGFTISKEEKRDLIEFLKALTDTSYRQQPNFRNPFTD